MGLGPPASGIAARLHVDESLKIGQNLDILKIWQVHTVVIILPVRYRKVSFWIDIVDVIFFPIMLVWLK